MFFHSFIAMEYAFAFFFAVNSAVNAARSSCRWKVHPKGVKAKTFPQDYVTSLSGVGVRCSRCLVRVLRNSFFPCFFFFPFFFFCVVIFCKYIPK